ncbi:ABC transporter permease [Maribacter dokdonensis]|uniref:ABC transporter permease n=1 Tax=Maribacter dokdonensis TaxID=320912 RepID=UPI002AB0AC15|nr:iron chelate uptake ABC transporter family permease subunit [Maribacter dokdonensis]
MVSLLGLLLVLAIVSLLVGVSDISFLDILSGESNDLKLLTLSRIPRTVALIITGIGISVCGLIMQQMTQNKFVSPTTAGTLDAAELGILGSLIFLPQENIYLKVFFALGITFFASLIFIKIADSIRYRSVIFIPIVGLLFGGIINSITTFFAFQFNIVQDVGAGQDSIGAWMMGDFSGILKGNYEPIFLCLPAVVITYWFANKFTVVGMGQDFAKNLGLNFRAVLNIGLFCVSLTVSSIVVTVGTIPFLGLVIPNIVSLFLGDNLRKTLPYTAIVGACFLLLCDVISRLLIFPFEVPIGMTVGLIGGVLFLILLLRKK